jgi:hypothetical protein
MAYIDGGIAAIDAVAHWGTFNRDEGPISVLAYGVCCEANDFF